MNGVLNAWSRSRSFLPSFKLVSLARILSAWLCCPVVILIPDLDVLPVDLWLHLIEHWLLNFDWNRLLLRLLDAVVVDIDAQIFALSISVDHQLNGWHLLLRIRDLALHNALGLTVTGGNFLVLNQWL